MNVDGSLSLGAVAFLVTAESQAGISGVNADGVLISIALRLGLFDAVLAEGHLLGDADVTLDAEVAVLAALGARLVASFLIGAASRLLFMGHAHIRLVENAYSLVGMELKIGGGNWVGAESDISKVKVISTAVLSMRVAVAAEPAHIDIAVVARATAVVISSSASRSVITSTVRISIVWTAIVRASLRAAWSSLRATEAART
jgi:hypothetical protein